MVPKRWKKPLWERVWPYFGSVGQRAFAHSVHALERSGKYGPHGELFFLPSEERANGPQ